MSVLALLLQTLPNIVTSLMGVIDRKPDQSALEQDRLRFEQNQEKMLKAVEALTLAHQHLSAVDRQNIPIIPV
jgi:hypothetical protein